MANTHQVGAEKPPESDNYSFDEYMRYDDMQIDTYYVGEDGHQTSNAILALTETTKHVINVTLSTKSNNKVLFCQKKRKGRIEKELSLCDLTPKGSITEIG